MNQTQWSEVKKVRFHHKVKRFYHKNLFRKIYTIAIIGLIGANVFSIVKYASFADEPLLDTPTQEQEAVMVTISPVDANNPSDADAPAPLTGSENSEDDLPLSEERGTACGGEVDALDSYHDSGNLLDTQDDEEIMYETLDLDIPSDDEGPSDLEVASLDPDIPYTDLAGNQKAIMSYNVGATSSSKNCWKSLNTGPCGNYYQWGRDRAWSITSTSSEQTEFNNYNSSTYNWTIGAKGPCPNNYHIPTIDEWENLILQRCENEETCDTRDITKYTYANKLYRRISASNVDAFRNAYIIPFPGFREANNSYNVSSEGYYWSSTPIDGNYARNFHIGTYSFVGVSNNSRSTGYPIRCISGSYSADEDPRPLALELYNSSDVSTMVGRKFVVVDGEIDTAKLTAAAVDLPAPAEGYERVWYLTNSQDESQKITSSTRLSDNANSTYSAYAFQEVAWNTAELTTTASGDYKLTYSGNTYIIASGNLAGTYKRGNNIAGDSTIYNYASNNDRWGGGDDTAANGYDSGNPRIKRQGPCPNGWHVPSRGEWADIVTARCHLSDNDCIESDLSHMDSYGNLYYIIKSGLGAKFKLSLGMFSSFYLSSTPSLDSPFYAWALFFRDDDEVAVSGTEARGSYSSVRCLKNPYTLTFDSQGGSTVPLQEFKGGQTRTRPDDPTMTDYIFLDWYTSREYTELFDFDQEPTEDKIAYAKWRYKDCAADQEYDAINHLCYKLDTTYTVPVYYGVDTDTSHKYNNQQIGTITVKINTGTYSGDTLTMMDMNLGATTSGTTCSSAGTESDCGELYQRGNNAPIKSATKVNAKADFQNYRPGHPFSGATFRYGDGMNDYWNIAKVGSTTQGTFDGLRGGLGDDTSGDRGGIHNGSTRQGPCPDGYHVPSMMEWETLLQFFANTVGQTLIPGSSPSQDFHYFTNNSTNAGKFLNAFNLSLAGFRTSSDVSLLGQGSYGNYWSSSPLGSSNPSYARFLGLNSSYVYANYNYNRVYGRSVRCFKDSPKAPEPLTLTFDANGGNLLGASESTIIQLVASGHMAQQPVNPTKDGLVFDKWTTDQAGESEFDFSTPVTSSTPTTLYAQYSCEDGYEKVGDNCEPQQFIVTFDANRGTITAPQTVYYGGKATQPTTTFPGYTLDGWYLDSGFNTQWNFTTNAVTGDITLYAKWSYTQTFDDLEIYFVKSDGSTGHYTIMDRNLGATAVYNQNISSPNVTSYGYYYQWGNNYGFPTEGNVTTTPTKVPYSVWSNYVPSNYASGIYVVGSLSSWMDGSINDNMWGGISSNTGDRQGPCPNEYHVPTISEWSSLYNTWYAITPSYVGSTFAYDFLLPSAGFRNYSNGVITYVNNYMDYWSSSPRQGDKTYASILDMRVSNSRIDTARSHLYGLPVRCFKDSINSDTITLHMDGGKNAIIAFTGSVGNGIFTSLGTPQRDASHSFSGWYADAGFNTPVTKGSVVTQDLYAKWSCATYYHDEGGECIYNTKTDNCTPGTVDNGHYVVEPVEITWNEGINNWNTVACTQLVCDTHYHTGSNNDTCEIDTFTITWKDGEEVLKSEILPYGANPSYSTGKQYYTFLRWDPSIVPVAGDQTYTAVWQANTDANGNNIADEEEPHHTLTIHYVNSKGNEVYPDYTESIVQGADYTIPSQGKLHYIVDTPIVSGTMGTEDVEVTVTYNTETDDTNNNGVADEDEIPHTLTINYVYSRGGKAADSISGKYLELIDYSITSPIIPNYDTNQLVVEGTMPSEDRTITVTYKPTNDDNTNGIADEEEDRYSVVVHYVYTGGRAVTGDQSVVNLLTDQGYNIASPEIQYYTADQAVVSGIIDGESMTGDFIEFTVTYTPNHDANNNGIADEEEKSNSSNYSGRGRKGESATNMHNSADDEKDPAQPITSNDDKQSLEINESTKNPESEMNTENYDSRYTPEQHSAYQFAKSHGITTTVSIREAKMNTPLTRIEMAKMLSYYAMNVMNKQPDMSIGMIKFVDVPSKLDAKYDNGVTLAYQLGIMGINMPENKFRPNDRVSRAEFATALSRMIYGMEDGKGRVKYYEPHIARLYNEGIINNTNPKLQEQRGYVMTMLMRSIK